MKLLLTITLLIPNFIICSDDRLSEGEIVKKFKEITTQSAIITNSESRYKLELNFEKITHITATTPFTSVFLIVGQAPEALVTSGGVYSIYKRSPAANLAVFNKIKERVGLAFLKNNAEGVPDYVFEAPQVDIHKDSYATKPLSPAELDSYRGTDAFIVSTYYHLSSIYKVKSIDGKLI